MRTDPIVIVSAARTAQGNLLGALKEVSAPQLGSNVIQTVVERAALTAFDIQEVWMGCVLSAGLGQAPARQASLAAGLSVHTPCTTINKMCGSGMQAVISAYDKLRVGHQAIYVAGGMESMTQAPYLLLKARQGYRLGHSQLIDHMMADGLEDAYHPHPMGYFAELCAREYGLTREQQDQYALASLERAQSAIKKQYFKAEISPVVVKTPKSEQIVDIDERPGSVNKEKIPTLPAIFFRRRNDHCRQFFIYFGWCCRINPDASFTGYTTWVNTSRSNDRLYNVCRFTRSISDCTNFCDSSIIIKHSLVNHGCRFI